MALSRPRSGVRRQATVAAVVVVAAALVLGASALLLILQSSLTRALEDNITMVLNEDANILANEGVAGLARSERAEGPDNVLVQAITPDTSGGQVVFTSKSSRTQPISSLRPGSGETATSGTSAIPLPFGLSNPLVVARGVEHDGAHYVLVAEASQESLARAVLTTAVLLAVSVPLLVALTGVVTWWRVGRALSSVEAIRSQVERTSASRLQDRVPVPATDDEIAHLAVTMNSMLARLEASQRAQRRFVSDASHELRSPIATITASLDVVSADDPETSWDQLAPILRSETRRMGTLVDNLLLLSQADDGAITAVRREVDLDDVVETEARRLRQLAPLAVQLDSTPVRVAGDEHQLQQVVRNLLDNAARHASTQVVITLTREGERAVLRVEDDGPGIRPADRDRIFERFVRLDESRSRHSGGAGLGLAIARELTVAHGGTLTAGEAGIGGASFELTLPLQPACAGSRGG